LTDLPIEGLSKEITFSIPEYFMDPDDEPLRFTVANSAPHVVNVNENGGQLYIVSLAYGLARVTVTLRMRWACLFRNHLAFLSEMGRKRYRYIPNPVKDVVWIRTAEEQNSVVAIYNSAGIKVFENEGSISPLCPAEG